MNIIKRIYSFKLLENSIYFKMLFMLWALLHSIGGGGRITRYFSPIFIIWGALLTFKNLVLEKDLIKKKYLYTLIAFLGAYVVTIFYNRQYNLFGNIKTLIWTTIMVFVIFINERSSDKEKIFNDIRKLSIVLTVSTFILSFISNLMFCFNIHYYINRGDGSITHQGFWAGRLWGIYVDPNQGATIAMCSILASIIILLKIKKNFKLINIFSYINIAIQYIYIILTGSRGGEIAFIFVLAGLIYLTIDFIMRNSFKKIYLRRMLGMIVGLIMALVIISTFNHSRELLGKIPTLTIPTKEIIDNSLGINIETNEGNVTMERPDVGEGKDISNGRFELWSDGFKLIKYSPLLGFGDRNIFLKAKQLTPGSTLEIQYVHNGFIHMLLSGGIIAVIIMFILLLFAAIDIFKMVFINNIHTRKYYIYSCMALIIVACLITGIFLTELFYQNSIISTIFWVYMGFVLAIEKKELIN